MASAIEKMRAAGIPVDKLSEAQQKVLTDLSDQEVATMVKVRERLQAAGAGEVEGYRMGDTGVFYY
jgi:hypothetical protein